MGHHRKMRFDRMFRAMGPFVAMAAMGGLMAARKKGWNGEWAQKARFGKWDWNLQPGAGKGGKFRFNGREGVSLDELDMAGEAPHEVVLACGDHVAISEGADFAIALQGKKAARDQLRFVLEDGVLFVLRDCPAVDDDNGGEADSAPAASSPATVTVTMPAPDKLTIAGSGEITTSALAAEAEVVIAGSGRVVAMGLGIDHLAVTIAGSGHFTAEGKAERLEISVAGSGHADLAALAVAEAEVDIAGSGNVSFACDGEVSANIMGSGTVTVFGSARCKVHAMGSGSLVCERDPAAGSGKAA
jgi:hypothetical protein